MSDFKCRHFEGEIILWTVRWYCRYGISYRDLEQMMANAAYPLITPRSTVGFRGTRRRWRSGCVGIGASAINELESGRNLREGSWLVDVPVPRCRQAWNYD